MANNKLERTKEEILRELSSVIRTVKDPRLPTMTSVVAVEVTKDLKYAKVHVSVMGSEEEKESAMVALKSASGYIRREISSRLNLRITPEFKFVLDRSVDYGMHINDLIHKINKGEL